VKLRKYKSIAAYREAQRSKTRRIVRDEPHMTYVRRGEIQKIAAYLVGRLGTVTCGVCHGSRNGLEQHWLRKFIPGAEVIGTDLVVAKAQHTVKMDFHDIPDGWEGRWDFIFSNSLDHSYDPPFCLSQWFRTLRPGGICCIGWSWVGHQRKATLPDVDCFRASLEEYQKMLGHYGEIETFTVAKDRQIIAVTKPNN
jgi:hypothetical protein